MLTFTRAPKTLLGPCEHALWNGRVFLSRHHIHMPDCVAQWREAVAEMMEDPHAVETVKDLTALDVEMAASIRSGDLDRHRDELDRWEVIRRGVDAIAREFGI